MNGTTFLFNGLQNIFALNSFLHFNLIFVSSNKSNLGLDLHHCVFSTFQFSFVNSLQLLDFEPDFHWDNLTEGVANDVKMNLYVTKCELNSVIVSNFFTLREADDFIDQIESFYVSQKNLKTPSRICSPIFLIFITDPISTTSFAQDLSGDQIMKNTTTDTGNNSILASAEKEKLNTWAKKFNVTTQVYIVFNYPPLSYTQKEEQNNLKIVYKIVEIYYVKNIIVVQDIHQDVVVPFKPILKNKSANKFTFSEFLQDKIVRRSNFRQAEVIGINVDHPDYAEMVKYKYDYTGVAEGQPPKPQFDSGLGVYEYQYLRDALNFFEAAATWSSYVKRGPNGTLIGLAIPLNNESADISISASEFLDYRMSGPDGITYLQPTFYNEISVFFKQPAAGSIRDVYLQAFSFDLWLTLIATWILIFVSLLTVVTLKKRSRGAYLHPNDCVVLRDSVLWVFSSVCQHGWYRPPYSMSIRIVFMIGILLGLITYVAYSAALVAILSVPVVPIQSFDDLLHQHFHINSDNHIPTANFVVQSLESSNVLPKLGSGDRNIEVSQNIRTLINSKMAVVSMSDAFYPVLVKRHYDPIFVCSKVSKVTFPGRQAMSSMLIKRGSPLREYLNYKVIMMNERGITFRLRNHYLLATTVKCLDTEKGAVHILEIIDIFTAFVLLFLGMSVALVAGTLEKLWSIKRRSYKNLFFNE